MKRVSKEQLDRRPTKVACRNVPNGSQRLGVEEDGRIVWLLMMMMLIGASCLDVVRISVLAEVGCDVDQEEELLWCGVVEEEEG